MTTLQPASSSASTAAIPISAWKKFVKVSAQRITRRPPPFRCGRCAYHSFSVGDANGGMCRFCETPIAALATVANGWVWVTKFTSPGTFEATRAAWSIRPNA